MQNEHAVASAMRDTFWNYFYWTVCDANGEDYYAMVPVVRAMLAHTQDERERQCNSIAT